jgi:subtilisin family serine protease
VRRFALLLSVALVAASAPVLSPAASAAPPNAAPPATAEPPAVPNQLLVGYDIGTSAAERADARGQAGARRLEDVVRGDVDRRAVELVALPSGSDRGAAIRRFEQNPNVAYAEPNWIVTHQADSNDPYYTDGSLWGMYGDGTPSDGTPSDATTPTSKFGSQAAEAWAAGNTGSDSVVVGVIDEGIDISHPDLADNIWVNPYDPVDGKDNDGNGYIDDTNGWDFHGGNSSVYDGGNGDKHGTHVAGTIAGIGGNEEGVAGVAWDATLISAKFLGPKGGYTSGAIKAVDYLTDLKTRHGMNIVASNNSWGGGGFSEGLLDAITAAGAAGILFVAAAGNDATVRYPSGYDSENIIAVASIDSNGALSSFSNYGEERVDLGAPGRDIVSTLPGGTYGSYSGTSMATPHVTGGLVLASASGIVGAAALKAAIFSTGVLTGSLSVTVTGKRLDVSSFAPGATPANRAPVAVDDSWTVPAGATLTENVLSNDSDPDGDSIKVVLGSTDPTVAEDGSFTYNAPSTATEVKFTYTVTDGADVDEAIVTIKVTQTKTQGGGGGKGGGGNKGGGQPSGRGKSTR